MAYKNVKIGDVYQELREVKKHLQHLEEIIIPEEKLSAKELKKFKKLRIQALRDYDEGKTVSVDNL